MKIINLTKNFSDKDIEKYINQLKKKYLDPYIEYEDIIEVKVTNYEDYLKFIFKVYDDSNRIIPETNEKIIREYTLFKIL